MGRISVSSGRVDDCAPQRDIYDSEEGVGALQIDHPWA